jgi:uncharacterized membrane protein (TIGR02234 family)
VTARREFGGAIAVCVLGAALVLLALRQGWARVDYHAPAPLPSGSVPVTGQDLMAAVSALALAALACLAAVIATRGLARRAAGVVMAGLGVWVAVLVTEPIKTASVISAAAGSASPGGFAGSGAGGTSAISGNSTSGNGLPVIGAATKVVLTGGAWEVAALIGAVLLVAAGLAAAWHGPRWPVMSARFDRPSQPGQPVVHEEPATVDGTNAALWEALDRGDDLTEAEAEPEPVHDAAAAVRSDDL